MAKQAMIPGTADDVPEEVQAAADSYVKWKRKLADMRGKMNSSLEELIALMKEHGVTEMTIDDQEKRLVLAQKDLVKILKRKDKAAGGASDTDDEEDEE